jgi:uncharacterized membrane protein YcaP (DUF421 family)
MEYWITVGRTVLLFIAGVVAFRVMGSQSVGRMTDFDLVVVIAIGALIGDGLADPELNVFIVITAIAALVLLQILTSFLAMKSPLAEKIVMGSPIKLVENGKLLFHGLRRARLTKNNLEQELRVKGLLDVTEIKQAFLEPSGKLSFIEKKKQPSK